VILLLLAACDGIAFELPDKGGDTVTPDTDADADADADADTDTDADSDTDTDADADTDVLMDIARGTILGDGDSAFYPLSAGDQDGDGYDDVFVAAFYMRGEGSWRGGAYLVSGPVEGEVSVVDATAKLLGEGEEVLYMAPANAGDVDGDGVDDFLIPNAPTTDLVFGPLSGTMEVASSGVGIEVENSPALSSAGDVDLDGYGDFIVGDGTADGGGVAWFMDGPEPAADPSMADGILVGDGGDYVGGGVTGAGDLDGDGFPDAVVRGYGPDRDGDGARDIQWALWPGPVRGTNAWADTEVWLHDVEMTFGATPAGDLDADGYDDLFVQNSNYDDSTGRVYLVEGPIVADVDLADVDVRLEGSVAGDNAGSCVTTGNFDGAGGDDVAVSAANPTEVGAAAYVVFSPLAGVVALDTADVRIYRGALPGYDAGLYMSGGDVDADGLVDLLFGITADSRGGPRSGAIAILYGDQL
jgi:hypothetical protein